MANRHETGILDCNYNSIFTGDKVNLFRMIGTVTYECGAYGIGFDMTTDWDLLESQILPVTRCDNPPHFCMNDNFISFWESLWNFNCTEETRK